MAAAEIGAQRPTRRDAHVGSPGCRRICDGEEQMQLAATLGVTKSEATPDVPARVATRVFPPSVVREPNQIPIFGVFMRMGLVPPFSDFFLAVLESFGLKLLNLTPGAILDLTLFAYACEAFIG